MDERWQKLILGIVAAVTLVLCIGIYAADKECEDKGGKRLRGMFLEGYKCYDASMLKVLP